MVDNSKFTSINLALEAIARADRVAKLTPGLVSQSAYAWSTLKDVQNKLPKNAIDFFARGWSNPSRQIPHSAFDLLQSMARQSNKLNEINRMMAARYSAADFALKAFSQQQTIYNTLHKSIAVQQIASLNLRINSLTETLAKYYIKNESWDALQHLEEFNEAAIEVSEELLNGQEVFPDIVEKIVAFFKAEIDNLRNAPEYVKKNLLALMTVFSFFWQFPAFQDHFLHKDKPATEQQFAQLIRAVQLLPETLKVPNVRAPSIDRRITTRRCSVRLSNKKNSICIFVLNANVSVDVLQIYHDRAYISYINPTSGFIECGWVMKKYLRSYRTDYK